MGNQPNYILPFYWQHGLSEELITKGMDVIYQSNIGAVCVESRPHPDFLGPQWWKDLSLIVDKAKEYGMKVWILDDKHFPSGYVNGLIDDRSPYRKQLVTHYAIDAVGPLENHGFFVQIGEEEELLGIVLAKRDVHNNNFLEEVRPLSGQLINDKFYCSIPEGFWTVIVIKKTYLGNNRKNYVNTIDRKAVRFFINQVYEKHYQMLEKEFGATIAGFFSDEPEIGNHSGSIEQLRIGSPGMNLPWCDELETLLDQMWQDRKLTNLCGLWYRIDGISARVRYEFMSLVTDLYQKNFSEQIGDWCREHKVEYIGHVIEDNGIHSKLGYGTGHFFKALWGQDMSGIDVVLQQIRPGLDHGDFYNIGGKGFYNGLFFHYGLAKMGVSLGHLDPKKKGRTVCEVFGAYGWAAGVHMMEWIVNHMLVRGVNHFVPHAFTMKDFPDPDCPPHFYAKGNNPQYPLFGELMLHTNRVCHRINHGVHQPSVALLYTAEFEWMGDCQPFEQVGALLTRNHIDYEVVPMDYLLRCDIDNESLVLNKECVDTLIIPATEYMTASLYAWCQEAVNYGLRVIYLGEDCKIVKEKYQQESFNHEVADGNPFLYLQQEKLVEYLWQKGVYEIRTESYEPYLRYYHYKREREDIVLFFNESPHTKVATTVQFNCFDGVETVIRYDSYRDVYTKCDWDRELQQLYLELEPSEFFIGIIRKGRELSIELLDYDISHRGLSRKEYKVDPEWCIAVKGFNENEFRSLCKTDMLYDLTSPTAQTDFAGVIRYEADLDLSEVHSDRLCLDFGDVYDCMELYINDRRIGCRLSRPYRFELRRELLGHVTVAHIRAFVYNTLVHRISDEFSKTMPIEPSGILGPVKLIQLNCSGGKPYRD